MEVESLNILTLCPTLTSTVFKDVWVPTKQGYPCHSDSFLSRKKTSTCQWGINGLLWPEW